MIYSFVAASLLVYVWIVRNERWGCLLSLRIASIMSDRREFLSLMTWNWRKTDWPEFRWEAARLALAEKEFLIARGQTRGHRQALGRGRREQITVDSMSTEAVTTSEIEGEMMNRASVQSSIRRQLGLVADKRNVRPAEQGVAEMTSISFAHLPRPFPKKCCLAGAAC